MARPKKATTTSNNSDKYLEEVYEKEITFICPKRGPVKQKIKVKRLKTPDNNNVSYVSPGEPNALDIIESKESGLEIYGVAEEQETD
jgi:hypothetical protein